MKLLVVVLSRREVLFLLLVRSSREGSFGWQVAKYRRAMLLDDKLPKDNNLFTKLLECLFSSFAK